MSYIWETLDIERIIEKELIRDLGKSVGGARFGYYTTARKNLLENLLEEIRGQQKDLTDHGPRHIKDVLENIYHLIRSEFSKKGDNRPLNGIELYVLGLSALFHDVGNIFSRKEHQKRISQIYDQARPSLNGHQDHEEKKLILSICRAHCGEAFDGSNNTLIFVDKTSALDKRPIRPLFLASILRFADELAEGEQRTSHYMLQRHGYSAESIIFHQYANCVESCIERHNGRIALSFHIELKFPEKQQEGGGKDATVICIDDLDKFLDFVYKRIEKLDQERQYTKHYCELLAPFKETSVSFNFWYNKDQIPIDLKAIVLSDLIVPGDPGKRVVDYDNHYNPSLLVMNLNKVMTEMKAGNS